jgi:uncharacterized membrane protein YdjX (TVP38/TMEM64 family)
MSTVKRPFSALLFLLLLVGLIALVLRSWISIDVVKDFLRALSVEIERYPVVAGFLLFGMHAVGMLLSIPVKAILSLIAGAVLGVIPGVLVTITGVITGATVLFFGIRRFRKTLHPSPLPRPFRAVAGRIENRPIRTIIGLRLFLTVPYGPITILTALSSVSYRQFFIGSVIGDLPVIALYVSTGVHLMKLSQMNDAVSGSTIALFCAAGAVFLMSAAMGRNTPVVKKRDPE